MKKKTHKSWLTHDDEGASLDIHTLRVGAIELCDSDGKVLGRIWVSEGITGSQILTSGLKLPHVLEEPEAADCMTDYWQNPVCPEKKTARHRGR